MLSKNQLRNISKLSTKKNRQESGLFLAEGEKLVYELLDSGWKANKIYTTVPIQKINHTRIDSNQMKKISHLASASKILGVFHIPKYDSNHKDHQGFSLVLDNVADPGNMGTIIRLCDWFGIKNLYCSLNSVDCFNPKVVQSTMGSIARVHCHYVDILRLIENSENPVYAATLDGNSYYKESFPTNGLLVMGSESHGISDALLEKIDNRITIPSHNSGAGVKSLNVAIASAILLGEIFRP